MTMFSLLFSPGEEGIHGDLAVDQFSASAGLISINFSYQVGKNYQEFLSLLAWVSLVMKVRAVS